MSRVSVIICTRNRCQEVLRCLSSLVGQTRPVEQVLIVDASDDTSLQSIVPARFSSDFADCRVLPAPPGLTRQRNLGLRYSQGDYIIFLDDDVILQSDYLEQVCAIFDADTQQRYAGGTGQIAGVRPAGPVRRVFQRVFYLVEDAGTGRFKPSGFPSLPHGRNEFLEVECLSGANMCFRRTAIAGIRFDEALHDYGYMEDDDFAYRVSRGRPLFYQPSARLEHRHSSSGRMSRRMLKRMLVRNHRYLFHKNFPRSFRYRWAHGLSLIGLLLECLLARDPEGLLGAVEGLLTRPSPGP